MDGQAGATPDRPLYMRWVADEAGRIRWGRVLLGLGLAVATAYLSVQTQRTASGPDFYRTLRMALARQKITSGVRMQQAGRRLEAAGWQAYEAAR